MAFVQPLPHAPQSLTAVSDVSQPLAVDASQLPKPALHEAIAQAPLVQVSEALGNVQATPQAAQLTSVVSAVSQPLFGLPSQVA